MAILDEPHHTAVGHPPSHAHAHPHRHHHSQHALRKADHIRDPNDHHDSKRKSETCTKCGKRIHQIMQSHHTATCQPVPSNSYHERNYAKCHPVHRQKPPAVPVINVKSVASQVEHRPENQSTLGKSSTTYQQQQQHQGKEGGNYNHLPLTQSYSSEPYDRQALSRKMENILLSEEKPRRGCPTHPHPRPRHNGPNQHQMLHNSSTQSEDPEDRVPSSLEEEGTSPHHHHYSHREVQQKPTILPSRVRISNSYTQTQDDIGGRSSRPLGKPPSAAKDCADAGRRIWQTLFEATEPAYESPPPAKLSIDLSLTNLNNQNGHKDNEVSSSPNPYQPTWSRREECPTSGNVLKRHASRHDLDCVVDGKFIRMKFGKKVKLVQIPPRIVDPENDEVQVLVRHGKSVLWRKYKTFEHD